MDRSLALQQLGQRIVAATPAPQHPALLHLVEALRARHGDCVAAVLYYGSCLRSGDPYDGLVDLYLIVDHYRCANASRLAAAWNWLLPPNVFYAEFPHAGRLIRCKYALLSVADLQRGTARWFHSYLWGRFSQPTALAWCRDEAIQARVGRSLAQAVLTFLNRALPALPATGSTRALWRGGLQLSYRAELRAESGGRAAELTDANLAFYQQVTHGAAALLAWPVSVRDNPAGEQEYASRIGGFARLRGRLGWALRRGQGKLLSVARLLKALFTFEGGLDYIAWKLERHSGVPVEIPDKVRRYPLIFIWGLCWDLYRRGAFR